MNYAKPNKQRARWFLPLVTILSIILVGAAVIFAVLYVRSSQDTATRDENPELDATELIGVADFRIKYPSAWNLERNNSETNGLAKLTTTGLELTVYVDENASSFLTENTPEALAEEVNAPLIELGAQLHGSTELSQPETVNLQNFSKNSKWQKQTFKYTVDEKDYVGYYLLPLQIQDDPYLKVIGEFESSYLPLVENLTENLGATK